MAHWKTIPGYPGIEISDSLTFRSVATAKTVIDKNGVSRSYQYPSKPLTIAPIKGHYPTVWVNSRKASVGVHVLVCTAFHGEAPGLMALHKDGDVNNWHPNNLYWGDHKNNTDDAKQHGTLSKGEMHGLSKLTSEAVLDIRTNAIIGDPDFGFAAFARKYGVAPFAIRCAHNGTTWNHL